MAFGTRRIDPTEHQDGLILAIAVEFAGQARRLSRRRRLRRLGAVRRPRRALRDRRQRSAHRRSDAHAARPRQLADDDAALRFGDPAAAAPVPRQRRREPQRARHRQRRGLAVPALSGADQPVRRAARDRRPRDVRRRRDRSRPHRAGAAAQRRRACSGADDDDRRHLGGDRHGGGRKRRAGDHRLQRSRHADPAARPRRASAKARRRARSARGCSGAPPRRSSACWRSAISTRSSTARRRSPRSACLSFAAVAQIAPAFLGGLVWRRGTARGAVGGHGRRARSSGSICCSCPRSTSTAPSPIFSAPARWPRLAAAGGADRLFRLSAGRRRCAVARRQRRRFRPRSR